MSTNLIILEGFAGGDPEIRTFPSGDKVAIFSLATSRNYRNEAGDRVENTDWHRLEGTRAMADWIEKVVKKGGHYLAEGELRYSNFEKNGQPQTMATIRIRKLRPLDRKAKDGAEDAGPTGDGEFENDIPQ